MNGGLERIYTVLAWIVGCTTFFVVLAFVFQLSTDPTSWWNVNDDVVKLVDMVHGWLFMVVLVLLAVLSRRYGWTVGFTLTTMVLATLPVVSFWAERRATHSMQRARAASAA